MRKPSSWVVPVTCALSGVRSGRGPMSERSLARTLAWRALASATVFIASTVACRWAVYLKASSLRDSETALRAALAGLLESARVMGGRPPGPVGRAGVAGAWECAVAVRRAAAESRRRVFE